MTRALFFGLLLVPALLTPSLADSEPDPQPVDHPKNLLLNLLNSNSSFTFYYTPPDRIGPSSVQTIDIDQYYMVSMQLNCQSNCASYLNAIEDAIANNIYYAYPCGNYYNAKIEFGAATTIQEIKIGSGGHCILIDGKTYIAETSLLNGFIGGFPSYFYKSDEYGMQEFQFPHILLEEN